MSAKIVSSVDFSVINIKHVHLSICPSVLVCAPPLLNQFQTIYIYQEFAKTKHNILFFKYMDILHVQDKVLTSH